MLTWPAAPISASVTDLTWSFSPNENASGDPEYRMTVPALRGPGPLGAVQVAEGHVAEPAEHGGGHVGDAADPDVPLGLGGLAAGDEGVRGDHGAADAPGGGVRPDQPGRLGQHRLVRPGPDAQVRHDRVGQQVRDPVDGHRAVLVGQQHRPGQVGHRGAQVDAGRLAEPGAEAQPDRGVMIPADEDDRDAGLREAQQGRVEQPDRVERRHRAVVDVPGHHHGPGPLADRLVQQPAQEGVLMGQQVLAVQRAPQMPVRGVDQSHRTAVDSPC